MHFVCVSLLHNSRLLNAKCCFSALARQGEVLCYKSTVGGERSGREARLFICSHYDAAAANTDRSFPSKRPLGTGYLHINGCRWFIYLAQLGSAKETLGSTCQCLNTPSCISWRTRGIGSAAGGWRPQDRGWYYLSVWGNFINALSSCSLILLFLYGWCTRACRDFCAMVPRKG